MADVDIPDLPDGRASLSKTSKVETSQGGASKYADVQAFGRVLGFGAYQYAFDTSTTASDPGGGKVRLNNATPSAATSIYIDDAEANGASLDALWDDLTAGYISIVHEADSSVFRTYKFTTVVDSSGYHTFTVSHLAGNGSFSNADPVRVWIGAGGGGGGGGGLTNFGDNLNSTSPNNSRTFAYLLATNAASDVDAALIPKGAGGVGAMIPTGDSTGGNKRGQYSADWQLAPPDDGAQVASGYGAFLGGGQRNEASGDYTVAHGYRNVANNYCGFAIGNTNTASGYNAFVWGESSLADGDYNFVTGKYGTGRGMANAWVHGGGQFGGTRGTVQERNNLFQMLTQNSTPKKMNVGGTGDFSDTVLALVPNSGFLVRLLVLARRDDNGDMKAWNCDLIIRQGGSGASATSLLGTPTVNVIAADSGASGWSLAVGVDTSLGSLTITGTGDSTHDVHWVARIQSIETMAP